MSKTGKAKRKQDDGETLGKCRSVRLPLWVDRLIESKAREKAGVTFSDVHREMLRQRMEKLREEMAATPQKAA